MMKPHHRRWWRRILKFTGVFIVTVLSLVTLAVGTFFFLPEITIPAGPLKALAARLVPPGVDLQVGDVELKLTRPRGMPLSKDLHLQATNLCLIYGAPALRACFAWTEIAGQVGWGGRLFKGEWAWVPRVIAIERFLLVGGDIVIDIGKWSGPSPRKKEPASVARDINAGLGKFNARIDYFSRHILPRWRVQESRVEILSLRLVTNENKILAARASVAPEGLDGRTFVGRVEDLREAGGDLSVGTVARFSFPAQDLSLWRLSGTSQLRWKSGRRLRFTTEIRAEPGLKLSGRVAGAFSGAFQVRSFAVSGNYGEMAVYGQLSLQVVSGQKILSEISIRRCDWRMDFRQRIGNMHCGAKAARLVVSEGRWGKGYFEPRLFSLAPRFELRLTRIDLGAEKAVDLELDLKLEHLGLAVVSAALKGHFEQKTGRPLLYAIEGENNIEVERFSRIVELLKATPYAVPAPLNVLDGMIRLRHRVMLNNSGGEIDYRYRSALDGQGEAIHVRLEGVTRLDQSRSEGAPGGELTRPLGRPSALRSTTDATIFIDRVQLTAPRFDLEVPPRLTPDRRFGPLPVAAKEAKVSPAPEPLDIRLRIRTRDSGALLLKSNLTKSPVPMGLDLTYEENAGRSPVTGLVTIGPTSVEAFRRNASLDRLRIELSADGENKINGRARIDDPDYTISIFFLGTTGEPVVRFASNPPLNDQQILAVLLFGRPLNELTAEQKASTANLKAAFTDAALGLGSIYLLAHTPVESVGYDVDRGLASVNLGLGGGATLELGTGSQANLIGFRKRLGHGFVFRSDVETLGVSGKRLISALFEWSKWF